MQNKRYIVIEPKVLIQEVIFRSFRNSLLEDIGYNVSFVQDNQVKSYKGALEGCIINLNLLKVN